MNLIRLLETSTFRLALIYLALFGVSALALLGFLYVRTAVVMEQQTEETIDAEIIGLKEQYQTLGLPGLLQVIERRSAANPNLASVYLLADAFGNRIAGNLESWPPGASRPGQLAELRDPGARRRRGQAIIARSARCFPFPAISASWSAATSRASRRPSRSCRRRSAGESA